MGRLTDFWQDRISLYPMIAAETTAGDSPKGGDGTLDSHSETGGMNTTTLDPSQMGKSRNAPTNDPATWSSGPDNNDYLAKQ